MNMNILVLFWLNYSNIHIVWQHSEDDSSGDIPQQDQVNKNFISRPQENNQQNQQQNCTCFIGDVKEDPSFLEIKKEPIGNFRDAVEAGADKNCVNAPSQNLNEAIRRESAIKRIYTGAGLPGEIWKIFFEIKIMFLS